MQTQEPIDSSHLGSTNAPRKSVRRYLLLEIAVVLGVLFLPTCLGQFLHVSYYRVGERTTEQLILRIATEVPRIFLILLVVRLAHRAVPRPDLCIKVKADVGLGLLVLIASLVIYYGVAGLAPSLLSTTPKRTPVVWPWWTLGLVVFSIVGSVIYQELLMRWYLISRLEQLGAKSWESVVAGAMLFGALHFYEGAFGAIYALLLGLLFGACFVHVRRIGPLVLAHFLWNFAIYLEAIHFR